MLNEDNVFNFRYANLLCFFLRYIPLHNIRVMIWQRYDKNIAVCSKCLRYYSKCNYIHTLCAKYDVTSSYFFSSHQLILRDFIFRLKCVNGMNR